MMVDRGTNVVLGGLSPDLHGLPEVHPHACEQKMHLFIFGFL